MTLAGKPVTRSQVAATLAMFRYFHAFLKSECTHCVRPGDWTRQRMDKEQVRRHLFLLIDVAINRKAGIPDETYAEQQVWRAWLQDQQDLHDITSTRRRVYQFRTPEVRQQFGHLLSRYDD